MVSHANLLSQLQLQIAQHLVARQQLGHAAVGLATLADGGEELGRVRGSLARRVAVGLPTSLARVLTVPLICAFRIELPDATLSISEGLSVPMQESLIAGRLDIAVLYNAQPTAEIEITPLLEEDLLLVQRRPVGLAEDPAPGPITLRELAQLPLVIPTRPNAIRMHVESELANIGYRLNIALEIGGVSAILDLGADGAGSAVLSRNAVSSSIRPSAFSARTITAPVLRTKVSMATSSWRPTTLTQQTTLKLLHKTICKIVCPI